MADAHEERRTVVERYFTRGYMTDINGRPGEDQCVLLHSNKICVITVSPEHPAIKNGAKISNINFQVSSKVNRLESKAVGKSKKGAQWLMPESPLCEISCSDGKKYVLNSCMKGKLIEINEELIKNPGILQSKPETDGYVAVVLPKLQEVTLYFDKLHTQEQYSKILEERTSMMNNNTGKESDDIKPTSEVTSGMVLWQAIKSLEILDKPELIFNRRLTANPYHPFQKDSEKKFVLHLDRRRYYYGVFMVFVCALIIAVWLMIGEADQYLLFPFLVGFISTLFAFDNKGDRVCTLDPATKTYAVAIGQHNLEGGEYRNVYIRLKAQKHGAGGMYYYVVFNGYHVSEQKITSYSKNDKKLRILAKRLAENLDLNFFDVKASSKEHIIRHRPAETSRANNRSVNNSLPV